MLPQTAIDAGAAAAAGTASNAVEIRPIDLVHLARYTMDDRILEREVLSLYRKQSVLYLERLRAAKNTDAWAEAAHTLKGSALGIGAWAVAEAAERVEALEGPVKKRNSAGAVHQLAERIFEANTFIHKVVADR